MAKWSQDPLTPQARAELNEEKRALFSGLVASDIVCVLLDPRMPSVQGVPSELRQNPSLRLHFSLSFPDADLAIDTLTLRQTLSFKTGERSRVTIPWSAVFAMSPNRDETQTVLWQIDVPSEVSITVIPPSRESN